MKTTIDSFIEYKSKLKECFPVLNNNEIDELYQPENFKLFKKGELVYCEKSRISGCFFILDGIVKVFKTGVDGKRQIIRLAGEGDFIGFRSIVNHEIACTSSIILTQATLLYLPASKLIYLINNNSKFSVHLIKIACAELDESNNYLIDIAQKTVKERLASMILFLKNRFGLAEDGFINIALTREELSNIIGTATESVIRLISELKSINAIEVSGRKIKILDQNKLIRIANL